MGAALALGVSGAALPPPPPSLGVTGPLPRHLTPTRPPWTFPSVLSAGVGPVDTHWSGVHPMWPRAIGLGSVFNWMGDTQFWARVL